MILYDDTTATHLDSAISVQSESEPSAASDAGSANRVDAPHPTQPVEPNWSHQVENLWVSHWR